ncbi:TetR/AcrR family transcriptional regulator [Paraburkholderia sprentiae WSM5005]|uniref:TetR/AcrR family transcriptional regulator n=1 Tax=Paraburkholderia sprentiae WSM5005 TaxID=754502 RepID=A0A1I9YFE2_9BURK|nr:TetR/AcrR family transcriptional regulator [Paraburkholderia sprentiae]APA85025.1 TetR/AcrR family transcriptional regulator [Paraburkholderia sprentiae WSM5005]
MGIAERKHRQKQALRERILDAARRIVVREGFAALSMRKIADAIEYSPATLYLHFESRDHIAHALCAEGYAQLLASFAPLAQIADPAERLRALGRAYVAFGVAHPETYRLIFMEDPSYTGAALAGAAGVSEDDTAGDAALQIMIDALDELRGAGRLSGSVASTEPAVWAEALWASLHGIVALNLTCSVFPSAPLETLVGVTLDAWLGEPQAAGAGASTSAAGRGKKTAARRRPSTASSKHTAPEPATKRKAAGP